MSQVNVPFRKGTLFFLGGGTEHLHIVMNDPVFCPERRYDGVCVVNITSMRDKHDPACLLAPGCHAFVRHDSYISYKHAAVERVDMIVAGLTQGQIRSHDPVSDELYNRVLHGFTVTRECPLKVLRFLRNQAKVI